MRDEDLRTVAQLGRALWADNNRSDPFTVEAVSAISILQLSEERSVERAARALLDRARRPGMAANTILNISAGQGVQNSFFRLFPEERFLLIALHIARWSYRRVAHILDMKIEDLEETVWGIRVKLGRLAPIGADARTANCPEYNPQRPWTQRFLDEEIETGRERVFLQNHLMACSSCQRALTRCRDIYFRVDKVLPRLEPTGRDRGFLNNLAQVARQGTYLTSPSQRTFSESLVFFLKRADVRLAIAAFLAFVFLARWI